MDEIKMHALPGMESALSDPLTESQLKSIEARRIFETAHDADPWMADYFDLIAEGWAWRQAVYMLWASQPRDRRVPATQEALAVEVLGLTSDRTIREWREKNPAFEARIARLVSSIVGKRRAEVLRALAESAASANPRSHADRRMFLEMSGDYTPKVSVNAAVSARPVEDLDSATLAAIAGAPVLTEDDDDQPA